MTLSRPIEILDLRHFTARQLRPLLEEQAAVWRARLRWDYRSSTELLLQYLDSRILPGFVALDRGRICGYTFCVYEGHKAIVGDLYAAHEGPGPSGIVDMLATHLLEVLEGSPDIDRVEAQLLLFDAGVLPPVFARPGFRSFPRLFLERELVRCRSLKPGRSIPAEVELSSWMPGLYQETAELIQACYVGHLDAEINDQYRTLHGSLRFLHNIVRFPGCGVFDSDSSSVLRERRSGALAAVLLCSRVDSDVAHVTQLCVAPRLRGQRLGELLLRSCMDALPERGYAGLTLTVSEGNEAALRLYRAAGFRTRCRFDALVVNKAGGRAL